MFGTTIVAPLAAPENVKVVPLPFTLRDRPHKVSTKDPSFKSAVCSDMKFQMMFTVYTDIK